MPQRRNRYLAVLAVFRMVKAAALFAAGIGALRLPRVAQWIARLPFAGDHEMVQRALVFLTHLPPKRAGLVAAAAFSYGAVMAVEGVGLWMQKQWAEWLTIAVTASFIPFEVIEIARRATGPRIAMLVINLAILAYLVVRRVRRR